MVKRGIDLAVSGAALAVLSPLLVGIAIAIKLHDGGPILYRGVRAGWRGVPFRMAKFRTMVLNADKLGGSSTSDDDPRITNVGRWLRKHKLDELPQLLNVLVGEMSLVGPRPEVFQYVNLFTDEEKAILSVRPGITDWASLWNSDEGAILAGSSDPERTYLEQIRPTKIRLQLKYVSTRSLWTDMQILFFTFMAVVFGRKPGWTI
jgi:lipopolysaccharide/colanic/teichoic acid biosynthesis glycosyltransferase